MNKNTALKGNKGEKEEVEKFNKDALVFQNSQFSHDSYTTRALGLARNYRTRIYTFPISLNSDTKTQHKYIKIKQLHQNGKESLKTLIRHVYIE